MSTYEDSLLAARFASLAPEPLPGNWDDVLGRAGARTSNRGQKGHRRRLLVAFAVIAIVAATAAATVGAVRYFVLDKGFIGVPPEGVVSSTPERGELVLRYFGPNPGHRGKSRVWVYADGRVISLRGTTLPEGANAVSTGFLEQRLTRDGVEKLRSEVAESTGVGQPPPGGAPLSFHTIIEVREGARLVRVEWSSDQARLEARLSDPASSLPAAAWQERVARAYVPSRFAVCYGGPWDRAVEPSRILSLLPAQAGDLLRANAMPSDRLYATGRCSYRPRFPQHHALLRFDARGGAGARRGA